MKIWAISVAFFLAALSNLTFSKEPLQLPTNQASVELAAPPLEGTVSIGVFDAAGNCIRVLYKNADQDTIPSALNGFLITWDGKNDAGTITQKGEYEIRGVTVGNVSIEGEAYHFNDWVDATHPTDIPQKTLHLEFLPEGFRAWQQFEEGTRSVSYDFKENLSVVEKEISVLPELFKASRGSTTVFTPDQKKVFAGTTENPTRIDLPELGTIIDLAVGKEGAFWVITRDADATQLRQYSLAGEFLRELGPDAEEIFERVAVSENDEKIALISRMGASERVRILTQFTSPTDNVSLWKTLLEKKIEPCSEFGVNNEQVIAVGNLPAEKTISISLIQNELTPNIRSFLALTPTNLPDGLWLTTQGGLPLIQITSDLNSRRMTLVRGKKHDSLRFYANIGGAVAEFSITGLANMMQFTSEKILWPPGPRQAADENDVPSNEPAPTP